MKRLAVLVSLLVVAVGACADTTFLEKQRTATDCGPAALATLLRYYLDIPVTEREVLALAKYDPVKGTSLLGLEEAATAKGCAADSFRMSLATLQEQLTTYPSPVIVRLLNPEPHFALVLAVEGEQVFLADPAIGNYPLRREAFRKRWHIPGESEGFVFLAATADQHVNHTRLKRTVTAIRRMIHNLDASRPNLARSLR